MRFTKIVATLGPASSSRQGITSLIQAGVNVFRLNFSHGTHASHWQAVGYIRDVSRELGITVAVLQDLCGPKVRVGMMENDSITLMTGEETTVTIRDVIGTPEKFQTCYKDLPRDVKPGERILLNDGQLELEVLSSNDEEIRTKIIRGGVLGNNKGMNLPGVAVSAPSVTSKDMEDLQVGIAMGVDFVALSFVRSPEDLRPVREALANSSCQARVIAKIEKPEAVDCIEDIIKVADGVMVARGDLGIEIPITHVPVIQKRLIRLANASNRYVIIATQMLESMIVSPIPTRAEVSDVANAIVDGADAVMLSGETAVGFDPTGVVRMMSDIAIETEKYLWESCSKQGATLSTSTENPIQNALGHAALRLVQDLNCKAIVVHTMTGGTALFMSKSRPCVPIIAYTPDIAALCRMQLFWGVSSVLAPEIRSRDALRRDASRYLHVNNIAQKGDQMLLIFGTSFENVGGADAIMVATVDGE